MTIEHAHDSLPAGWYRDGDPTQLRWWDGTAWTDRVKAAVALSPSAPRSARMMPLPVETSLLERNRIALTALIVALAALAVVAAAWLVPTPTWLLPVVALGGGILSLALGVSGGRRAVRIATGRNEAMIATALSVVLVIVGLGTVILRVMAAGQLG
jgi:hypothetical protein